MTSRPALVISAILLIAFIWGYRGQEITEVFLALFGGSAKEHLAVDSGNSAKLPEGLRDRKPKPVIKTTPPPQLPSPAAPVGGNPAPQPPRQTLSGTLDSITPGEIQEDQQQRRNLYFDRLSKQLSKIQAPGDKDATAPATEAEPKADTEPAAAANTADALSDGVLSDGDIGLPEEAEPTTPGDQIDDEALKKELENLLAE